MFSVSSHIILIVTELTGAGQDATHVARLQARSMFKDIRAEAEEYIYKKLVSYIPFECWNQVMNASFIQLRP